MSLAVYLNHVYRERAHFVFYRTKKRYAHVRMYYTLYIYSAVVYINGIGTIAYSNRFYTYIHFVYARNRLEF